MPLPDAHPALTLAFPSFSIIFSSGFSIRELSCLLGRWIFCWRKNHPHGIMQKSEREWLIMFSHRLMTLMSARYHHQHFLGWCLYPSDPHYQLVASLFLMSYFRCWLKVFVAPQVLDGCLRAHLRAHPLLPPPLMWPLTSPHIQFLQIKCKDHPWSLNRGSMTAYHRYFRPALLLSDSPVAGTVGCGVSSSVLSSCKWSSVNSMLIGAEGNGRRISSKSIVFVDNDDHAFNCIFCFNFMRSKSILWQGMN